MLLKFGIVGEHLGMRVSLDERIMEVIDLGGCLLEVVVQDL